MGAKPKIPVEQQKRNGKASKLPSEHSRGSTGRPHKPIDWEEVKNMLLVGCTGSEIASCLNMHPNTFYDRVILEQGMHFTDFAQIHFERGNRMLRAVQFECAVKKKDRAMMIFLGKNRLGQTDKVEQKIETTQEITQKAVLELPENGNRKEIKEST